jgi:serine/threonine protein kinase
MYKARRAASLKVRRRIGKYELGRTIGEGTFAKVRIAKNMESGDHVAIKILDKVKVHKHGLVEQVSIVLLPCMILYYFLRFSQYRKSLLTHFDSRNKAVKSTWLRCRN